MIHASRPILHAYFVVSIDIALSHPCECEIVYYFLFFVFMHIFSVLFGGWCDFLFLKKE